MVGRVSCIAFSFSVPDSVRASLQLLWSEELPAGEGCSRVRMNKLKCVLLYGSIARVSR